MYFYFYRIKIIVICITVKKGDLEDHSFTGLSNFTGLV